MLASNRIRGSRLAAISLIAIAIQHGMAADAATRNAERNARPVAEPVTTGGYTAPCEGSDGCDACLGDCTDCGDWSEGPRASVYAIVDALFLFRHNDDLARPLVIDTNSDNTLLWTTGLDYDGEPGVRATVGLWRPPCSICSAWEFTYLGVSEGSASATVTGDNNLAVPGDLGFAVNGFTLAESIRTEYRSDLQSAEVNCVGCLCDDCGCDWYQRVDWFIGVRYLSLREELAQLGYNENVAAAVYDIETDNNLYGVQLGTRMQTFRGCLGWELLCKGGLFANDASQSQRIVDELGVNDFLFRNASASDTCPAFVGEVGLSLLYDYCGWGLRCGYNVLWVSGVALAAEQLDYSDTIASGAFLQGGRTTVLHGFNAGVEFGW